MRILPTIFIASIVLLSACGQSKTVEEISIGSLLSEMIDRDHQASFPDINYSVEQASSYNRESVSPDKSGWFADSDGVGFVRTEVKDGKTEWVLMEDFGPGCITKIWAVCFYYALQDTTGGNIKIYLDGATEPAINVNLFQLVKGHAFIKAPFAQESARAGNLYFPIPYAKSCKITMDKKSFYNIINYRKYPPGTKIKSFSMSEFAETDALQKQVAKVLNTKPDASGANRSVYRKLRSGERLSQELPSGNGAVKQFEIRFDSVENIAQALRSVVLAGEFDDERTIWAPVGDFFNNVGKLQPYQMWERSVTADGRMVCRWVMPYESKGTLYLENLGDEAVNVEFSVITDEWTWDSSSMHFYATWRMDPPTPTFPLYDWNFLEAEGTGVLVGDEWSVLNPAEGWWGEGDEKIYVDDDVKNNFPSHFGTGTEDYYGWAGGIVPTSNDEFSHLFLGNIIVADPNSMGYNVCTRTRVLDAIPFTQNLKFDFESSCGTRQTWFYLQYAQTTFWYAIPGVKHNRSPLPAMAAMTLPALETLHDLMDKAKGRKYFVTDALEAELLDVSNHSDGMTENFSTPDIWGELSNGQLSNLWFEKEGDFAEFKVTEQFKKSKLYVSAVVSTNSGKYEIYVNDKKVTTHDFYSDNPGITNPYIDLGEWYPENNSFVIRFVLKGGNIDARREKGRFALGVDFFLVQ